MKKNRSLILNIPDPCTESWSNMNAATGGRFCEHCQKKVIDFSGMSDREIRQVISNSDSPLCGRFDMTQLGRELTVPAAPKRSWLPAAVVASLMTLLIPEHARAGSPADMSAQSVINDKGHIPKATARGFIEGTVVDAGTNEGLAGVTIYVDKQDSGIGAVTDLSGHFRVALTEKYHNRPIHLKVTHIGFESKDVCIDIDHLAEPVVIQLQKLTMGLTEVTVSAVCIKRTTSVVGGLVTTGIKIQKLNWWQRFLRKFKRSRQISVDPQ